MKESNSENQIIVVVEKKLLLQKKRVAVKAERVSANMNSKVAQNLESVATRTHRKHARQFFFFLVPLGRLIVIVIAAAVSAAAITSECRSINTSVIMAINTLLRLLLMLLLMLVMMMVVARVRVAIVSIVFALFLEDAHEVDDGGAACGARDEERDALSNLKERATTLRRENVVVITSMYRR
jgi:hypothetical protein